MTQDHEARLQAGGDPVEKAILADREGLHGIIEPYAKAWAVQLLPRRNHVGTVEAGPWHVFGSHHYTALLRTYNANRAVRSLAPHCIKLMDNPKDGLAVLEIHNVWATAWEGLGAAIENLEKALEALPGGAAAKIRDDQLAKCYERRSQSIHSVVSPVIADRGEVRLYLSHVNGDVSWQDERRYPRDFDEWIQSEWKTALNALAGAWHKVASAALNHERPTLPPGVVMNSTTLQVDSAFGSVAVSATFAPQVKLK
jgi:hypothetical protein